MRKEFSTCDVKKSSKSATFRNGSAPKTEN
jgi:hypothetical protein